jgi:malate dehydrogenase (oxaloacetate-decarboxylating)(NADP+)
LKNLLDIIDYVKPTALLGLSTMKGAFTQEVIEKMAALNPRPIIFPLSNPVSLSECEFKEAIDWTDGKVIFASGSPFLPYTYKGKEYYPGQGNNMYVFPGIGLGGVLSKCAHVSSSMVENGSLALAESLTEEER